MRKSPLRTPATSCLGSEPSATRAPSLEAPTGSPRSTSPMSLSTRAPRSAASFAARAALSFASSLQAGAPTTAVAQAKRPSATRAGGARAAKTDWPRRTIHDLCIGHRILCRFFGERAFDTLRWPVDPDAPRLPLSPSPPLPSGGRERLGRYELCAKLADGGMATVNVAITREGADAGRVVAV